MTSSQLVYQLLALLAVCSIVAGSSIHMYADPPSIKPLLTPHLTITCELNSTSLTNNVQHVDDDEDADSGGHQHPKDCNVTTTSKEIEFISSILITKDTGEEVASVTEHDAARLNAGASKVSKTVVTGYITGGAKVRGYLQVTMPYPSKADAGVYVCDVTAVAKGGQGIGFKSAVNIDAHTPSVSDLVSHVHDQEIKMVEQRTLIDQLIADNKQQNLTNYEQSAKLDVQSKQLEGQSILINQQTKQLGEQSKQLGEQSKQLGEQSKQITQLLTKTAHVETGRVKCGDSDTWTSTGLSNGKGGTGITKAVTFKNKYSSPPLVHLSVVTMYTRHTTDYKIQDYWVDLVNVTETDFGIQCRTWKENENHYRYIDLDVQWVSFPEYIA